MPSPETLTLSFDALYVEHFSFVWRNVRRLGVPEGAADDVAQDVFLRAFRRLPTFEGRSAERTWLFGILVHVVQEHGRARARHCARIAAFAARTVAAPGPTPADETSQREAARILEELVADLNDDKRAIFVLVELEGTTVADAATALGLNVNTAHARLRAARHQFHAAVERRLRALEGAAVRHGAVRAQRLALVRA